jgi:hypothetical protein
MMRKNPIENKLKRNIVERNIMLKIRQVDQTPIRQEEKSICIDNHT